MEFKDRLRELRKERGMSQQALADAIFVSRSAVAKWENGLGLPGKGSMEALLDYFGVSREYFVTEQPEILIVEKNRRYRALSVVCGIFAMMLAAMLILFVISIPLVNDFCAAQVEKRLISLPLPEDTAVIESLHRAGKLAGNGNGMQFLGAVLVRSELPMDVLSDHYPHCDIRVYDGGTLPFINHASLAFNAQLEPDACYYVIYDWGNGINLFEMLDIRGH